MKTTIFIALLILAVSAKHNHKVLSSDKEKSDGPLQINLYTESLCPDCIAFITKSLSKAVECEDFFDMVELNIFPYGNAFEKDGGDTWKFTCQHGPTECYGNALENCAKSYYTSEQFWNWLVCLETRIEDSGDFDVTGEECANEQDANWDDIHFCAWNATGNALSHESGVATENLDPAHTWVPWVTVNDGHDVGDENFILVNILGYACANYGGKKSDCCA